MALRVNNVVTAPFPDAGNLQHAGLPPHGTPHLYPLCYPGMSVAFAARRRAGLVSISAGGRSVVVQVGFISVGSSPRLAALTGRRPSCTLSCERAYAVVTLWRR